MPLFSSLIPQTLNHGSTPKVLALSPAHQTPQANSFEGKPKSIGLVGTNREGPEGLQTGYVINPAYWNRGYASEAFAAFLKLYWTLEERRNFDFLVARADPGNFGSIRVLQKAGARNGGELKDPWTMKREDGQEEKRSHVLWIIDRPAAEVNKRGEEEEKKAPERSISST